MKLDNPLPSGSLLQAIQKVWVLHRKRKYTTLMTTFGELSLACGAEEKKMSPKQLENLKRK